LINKVLADGDCNSHKYFLCTTLLETKNIVLENIKKSQAIQKKYFDKKTHEKNFNAGNLVLVTRPKKNKTDVAYHGPFVVVSDKTNFPPNTVNIAKIGQESKYHLVSSERVKIRSISELRNP